MYRIVIRLLKIFISIGYNIIKHIIIFLYKTSVNQQCVVLYYHSVLESQRERFIRQLDYLSKKFSFVSLRTLDAPQLKKNLISITFDDGLSSILKNALPELKKRKIPTTIFIPAANIDNYPKWEQKGQAIYYEDRIINRAEIKELSDWGIEIASHTLHHTDLRNVPSEAAREELHLSKSILEEIIGKEVVSFSFPYGSYNDDLINLALDCGYNFVYTTQPEIIFFPTEKKYFGRISVDPTDYFLEFKLKVAGAYSWLPRAIKLKKKIKKFLSI
jgi:peptidoglycan/xylan/chitin deacetylase (PgdA/CDA1 family)